MTPQSWKQIDELFQAALDLDENSRADFLESVCRGDPALRSEIESLLASDSLEWDLLEAPALESAAVLLADEEPRLVSGQQISHYEIVCLLGTGGMGEVYTARDQILNRDVAIKLLPADQTSDQRRLERFRREAEAASALNHPNIITVYELGDDDGRQFIATEFVTGETLRTLIRQSALSESKTIDIGVQTARALAAAHRAGIIHRDIKPENIMVRPDGLVKVLDFGLAKLAERREPETAAAGEDRLDVSSGLLLGTARYMSPEQTRGLPADARSDLFSLGVVLYECVSGRPPFTETEPLKLIAAISTAAPAPLSESTDQYLAAVILRLLSKDPEHRYQTADDVIADLRVIGGEKSPRRESSMPVWRRSSMIALGILLTALSAVGFAAYKFLWNPAVDATALMPRDERGVWNSKSPISSPRLQVAAAVVDEVLYAVGGWNGCTPFGELQSYDSANNFWHEKAPMPTPRGAHGVGVADGKIYAVGGSTDCGNSIASVEAYDPSTDRWSAKKPLPMPRSVHVVASVGGKIYAIGGKSPDESYLDLNTRYDPESDTWTEMTPIPTARVAAAAVVVDGIIYVIGGSDRNNNLSSVEAYDPVTNSWTSKRSMPTSRERHSVAEVNGLIYAIGGEKNRTTVEEYDPLRDLWKVVGDLPNRASSTGATSLGGAIYLLGGFDGLNHLSSVTAFTPPAIIENAARQSCPRLRSVPIKPMGAERSNMAVGVIDEIVYVIGGYVNDARYLDTNEAYDPRTDRWTVKASMPTPRELHGPNSAVVEGKFYVIGGSSAGRCTDVNQAYDPKTDRWSTLSPMPTPRCHLAVVALDGMIFAIGGTNTSGSIAYTTVEVYDPASDRWTENTPLSIGRWDMGAAVFNGLIYVIGGSNPAFGPDGLAVTEAFDPVSRTWVTKSQMTTGRASLIAGVLADQLVVIGGASDGDIALATVEVYDSNRDKWTLVPNMITARRNSAGIMTNDRFYSFGGSTAVNPKGFVTQAESGYLEPCSSATQNAETPAQD